MKKSAGLLKSMAANEQPQAKELVKGLDAIESIELPAPLKKLMIAAIDALQEFATPHLQKVNGTLAFAFNAVCEAIEGALK